MLDKYVKGGKSPEKESRTRRRFNKKFKKSRAAGKETFKFRPKQFNLLEKRNVYSTKIKENQGGKEDKEIKTKEDTKDKQGSPMKDRRMFNLGGVTKDNKPKKEGANYMSYDEMINSQAYKDAKNKKDYAKFTYWEEVSDFPDSPSYKKVMTEELNADMKPKKESSHKDGGKVSKYPGGGTNFIKRKYNKGGVNEINLGEITDPLADDDGVMEEEEEIEILDTSKKTKEEDGEGNYNKGSDTPQVVRDKDINRNKNNNKDKSTEEESDKTIKVKKTKDERFDEREARRQKRMEDRLERKRKREARRKHRKESRQYRRTMRRKARQQSREDRGFRYTGGRMISPRRWYRNLKDKLGISSPRGNMNLKDYDKFKKSRTKAPVREYNMGGMAMHGDSMNMEASDRAYVNRQERKAARKERKADRAFDQGKEGKGIRKEQKADKAASGSGMYKKGGVNKYPGGGTNFIKRPYRDGGKVKKYPGGGTNFIKRPYKDGGKVSKYPGGGTNFIKRPYKDGGVSKSNKEIDEFLKQNKAAKEMKDFKKMNEARNLDWKKIKQPKTATKKLTKNQIARILAKKGGKALLRRLGYLGAALTIHDVAKNVAPATKPALKKRAKSGNYNMGRKI